MPFTALRERIRLHDVVFAVLFALAGTAVVLAADGPIDPLLVAAFVVATAYMLTTSVHAVRDHDLYHLASAVVVTSVFAVWWVSTERPAVLPALVVAIGVLVILVELYNLVQETAYLRMGA